MTPVRGTRRMLIAVAAERDTAMQTTEVLDPKTADDVVEDRPLPLTEIDFHVTGVRGLRANSLSALLRLLRHIGENRRDRPDPIEQDYVTGYLRELLGASRSAAERARLRVALDGSYRESDAVRGALDIAWSTLDTA